MGRTKIEGGQCYNLYPLTTTHTHTQQIPPQDSRKAKSVQVPQLPGIDAKFRILFVKVPIHSTIVGRSATVNSSVADTIGTSHFVPYIEVSPILRCP